MDGGRKLTERYLLVMLGGATGSLARYVAGTAIMTRFGGRFPMGTLVINVTGSFLIGLLMSIFTERFQVHPYWRLLLVVGFLGGYTTFSSFEYETFTAVRAGSHWVGLVNVVASVVFGYIAVWLGALLATRQ
jgi:CrcB protein